MFATTDAIASLLQSTNLTEAKAIVCFFKILIFFLGGGRGLRVVTWLCEGRHDP